MIDTIYCRLVDRDLALQDPEVVMLLAALINILGHDNRGQHGVLDRPNIEVMRWRNGALSGSDLANEPGFGSSRTYQPGKMPLPAKPRHGLGRIHQKMNSEAASSSSQQREAEPSKLMRLEEEVQTNETLKDLSETKEELERVKETLLRNGEDRYIKRRLIKNCNNKECYQSTG